MYISINITYTLPYTELLLNLYPGKWRMRRFSLILRDRVFYIDILIKYSMIIYYNSE